MATRFSESMSAMSGAADMVLGFENQRRQWMAQDIAMEGAKQKIRFAEDLHPYDVVLARETASSQYLGNLAKRMGIYQTIQANAKQSATEMSWLQAFNSLFSEFSAGSIFRTQQLSTPAAPGQPPTTPAAPPAPTTPAAPAAPLSARGVVPGEPYSVPVTGMPALPGEQGGDAIGHGLSELGPKPDYPSTLMGELFRGTPGIDPDVRRAEPVYPDQTPPFTEAVEGGPGGGDAAAPEVIPEPPEPMSIVAREAAAQAAKKSPVTAAAVPAATPSSTVVAREIESRRKAVEEADKMPAAVEFQGRLKALVLLGGGLEQIGKNQPGAIPHLARMLGTLENDPSVATWQARQKAKVVQEAQVREVMGKVISSGLPVEEFAGVIEGIRLGFNVDPGTIDERIKTALKIKEEAAKKKLELSNSLTAFYGNPVTAPVARAGAMVFGRASKEKSEGMRATLAEMLQRGDIDGAKSFIKAAAVDLAPTAVSNTVEATRGMAAAVEDIKGVLTEYYKKYDTGPVKGRQFMEATEDPEIIALRTRLSLATAAYTKAMSGASFTEQEAARYAAMFPSVLSTKAANDEKIKQLSEALGAQHKGAKAAAYGDIAPILEGGPTNEDIALMEAVQPRMFNGREDFNAAVARGEVKPGQKVMVGNMVFTYPGSGKTTTYPQ
jgi:hypothetical protein